MTVDENDDIYREEPERIGFASERDYIEYLRDYAADITAEAIKLRNLVNDLDRCRFTPCNHCKHFKPNESDFCGLDIDQRISESRIYFEFYWSDRWNYGR